MSTHAQFINVLQNKKQSVFAAKQNALNRVTSAKQRILSPITVTPTYDDVQAVSYDDKLTSPKMYDSVYTEGTVDKMINSIVDNPINKPLKVAIKSYEDLQAYKANLQTKMNELTTAQKLTDAQFSIKFKDAPVRTLTDHILSAPTRKMVLESLQSAEQTEDLQDTISNAWKVTNFVYKTLKDEYPNDTSEQLGKRSKRVLDTVVPKNEVFGKEFTISKYWSSDVDLSKQQVIRASKESVLFE